MFGVLVVKNSAGSIGFLKAFSGKLDNDFWPTGYVPAVFNVHHKGSFFKKGEKELDQMTNEIKRLENNQLELPPNNLRQYKKNRRSKRKYFT